MHTDLQCTRREHLCLGMNGSDGTRSRFFEASRGQCSSGASWAFGHLLVLQTGQLIELGEMIAMTKSLLLAVIRLGDFYLALTRPKLRLLVVKVGKMYTLRLGRAASDKRITD